MDLWRMLINLVNLDGGRTRSMEIDDYNEPYVYCKICDQNTQEHRDHIT
jgi:hypothetical protein